MSRVASSGNQDIDGLLWGYKWDQLNFSYSTPTSDAEYTSQGYWLYGFQAMTSVQQSAIQTVMANFSNVCGLNFAYTTAADATVRFAETVYVAPPGSIYYYYVESAQATPPDPSFDGRAWGDVWLNTYDYNSPDLGSFAYAAVFMHEVGHAVGLKHGHAAQSGLPTLPYDHDSYEYSVMTYRQYVGDNPATFDNAPDHPTTLMMNDIAALQYLYGADNGYNSGNTTYTFSTTTGEMFINGVGQGAAGANYILLTVWDGGGNDTYDFSNYATNASINLLAGSYSTPSSAQRADLGDGYFARGSIYNAYQNGDSLIENAFGGSGDDSIVGNQANNLLRGHGGNDGIMGGYGHDTILGDAGSDTLMGEAGNDAIDGGSEVDFILCGDGVDVAFGGAGNDQIMGQGGNDVIWGENDSGAAAGDDQIDGGAGNDTLLGQGGNDIIGGGDGNDAINGGDGSDLLYGYSGADIIFAGAGGDLIYGGQGGDVLKGEAGGDLFCFSWGDGGDLIMDFNFGGDRDGIDLRSMFDTVGFAGNDPRSSGLLDVHQNGADTDIYVNHVFTCRIENVVAAALDDSYFLFQ
jgi:serralysin